ncbi:MAG: hypothetical protein H7833_05745 [Magnetococcus sp. DMHC-1]|nr:hypothetical protein [Magnetococcales bacterium]
MNIAQISFTNAEENQIVIHAVDGQITYCTWPCQTWHRVAIDEWLAMRDEQGNLVNQINPFVMQEP